MDRISQYRLPFEILLVICSMAISGCYTPLTSRAIPASSLPDEFRVPVRTYAPPMNLAAMSTLPENDYRLGTNDVIEVTGNDPFRSQEIVTFRARVMHNGEVNLPVAGSVLVAGQNLSQAQDAINRAFSRYIRTAAYSVSLVEKGTIGIPVLGEVVNPGVYPLPRNENAVAHALGYAGGLTQYAADYIEVHRVVPHNPNSEMRRLPLTGPANVTPGTVILRIPLRSPSTEIISETTALGPPGRRIELQPGDVVIVPRQQDEAFFVVGPLSEQNLVNFTVTDRDRQLGNALLMPKDRDIDVVTAVAMAGYIDPIYSPSTVTVHRSRPGCPPMLVKVDLIKARYNWQENLYVQPGDIIYLNPDAAWWCRRTFDRIVPVVLTGPYLEAMGRLINPGT